MFLKVYIAFVAALALVSCAQVRSVSGGEKDVTPPVVLFSDPPFLSTHISPQRITLTFDEYVQLNNIQQELVISPPLAHAPITKVKGKSVVLTFQDSLLPSTTYQINFGDGVVDVNENNQAKDLIYVFSTGAEIDSLTYSGKVHLFQTDEPGKNMKVMLCSSDSSIFIKKSLPLYFAKTKEDGSFRLAYLSKGNYFLYALDDLNGNYTWDEGEAIAVHGKPIAVEPGDSITDVLAASVPRSSSPSVKEYISDSLGSVKIVIDNYYHDLSISSLSGKKYLKSSNNDTIQIWLNDSLAADEELFRIQWKNLIDDTISIRKFDDAVNSTLKLSAETNNKILVGDDIILQSPLPLIISDRSMFILTCDSVLQPTEILPGNSPNSIRVRAKKTMGKKYDLSILPGAVSSFYGAKNDSLSFQVSCYKTEELGTLHLSIHGISENMTHVFYLYNKSNELVYKSNATNDVMMTITDLPAGEYSAKLLCDENGNGYYDPIDLINGMGPERIHIFKGKIAIRANWDVKTDWNINK